MSWLDIGETEYLKTTQILGLKICSFKLLDKKI